MIRISLMTLADDFSGRLVNRFSCKYSVLTFSQKVQHNQKVQECQSLRTELGRFASAPAVSTASSAASAHAGLSSMSRSSASPPSSRVASPTSPSPTSYLPNIASPLSRLGLSRSASVAPPTRSASVAPTSPSRSGSTVPGRSQTPGISSHRSATPAVPSYRSSTPASPSPVRKSRTMSISQQQPPLPSMDRWPAALTAALSKPSAPAAAPRPVGPRVPTRA
jgi:hypothetical protein